MTEQEQNIAIGEACGWEKWDAISPIDRKTPIILWTNRKMQVRCELPDYVHDLNAMHEAVNTLKNGAQYREWSSHLLAITSRPYNATAAERAEAFLRTIGKWKE